MAGYTVVFDSVYDGTLCGKWPALPVWLSILPMADKDGKIDKTYTAISKVTGWPIEILKQGIAELMEPDPESRSEEHEGRRLIPLDPDRSWGWQVVNHAQYREKARKKMRQIEETQSGRDAERKRLSRCPVESGDVQSPPGASGQVRLSDSDSDSDSDTEKTKNPPTPPKGGTPAKAVGAKEDRAAEAVQRLLTVFPKRHGTHRTADAVKHYRARRKEGHTFKQMFDGCVAYAGYVRTTGAEGTPHVMQLATFLGTNKAFLDDWKDPPARAEKPARKSKFDLAMELNSTEGEDDAEG